MRNVPIVVTKLGLRKLAFLLALGGALVVAAASLWTMTSLTRFLSEHEMEGQTQHVTSLSAALDESLGRGFASLETAAPTMAKLTHQGDKAGLARQLESLHAGLPPWIETIAVVDRDGNPVQMEPGFPDFSSLSISQQPFFVQLLSTGKRQTSGALKTTDGKFYLALATPLNSDGALVSLVDIQALVDAQGGKDMASTIFLLDRELAVASLIWAVPEDSPLQHLAAIRTQVFTNSPGSTTCHTCHSDSGAREAHTLTFVPLSQAPSWVLTSMTPESVVTEATRIVQERLAVSGAFILLLVGGMVFLAFSLTFPRIKALSQASRQVAAGNLKEPVGFLGWDEIGALGADFETMRQILKAERENLERQVAGRTRERDTLQAIIASMGEGLITVDTNRQVMLCNQKAEQILGLKASDFIGRPVDVLYDYLENRVVEPKDWRKTVAETFASKGTPWSKISFRTQSPELKDIEATLFTVGVGTRLGTGAVLRDITREREVDRMKTEFISVASHELRTPMTGVYGFSELLLNSKNLLPEEREYASWIYQESHRLNTIIEDLLNVSRIEMGRLSLDLKPLAVAPLVAETINKVKSRYPSHSFQLEIPPDFPEIMADADRLTQIMYNLLDNAGKYSPAGSEITIRAKVDEAKRESVLAVTDKAGGIPQEAIPLLFQRFFRVQRDKDTVRGTGLGLYICKSLVEMMKGHIWVETQINEGSTFFVSLPLVAPVEQ